MTRHGAAARPGAPLARLDTFVVLGVVALLALLVAVVAWTTPARVTEDTTSSYTQTVRIGYDADTAPDSTYGSSGLQTGETVLLDEVEELRVRVAYALRAADLTEVRGTVEMEAVVEVSGGLRRTFPVTDGSFDGPRTVLTGPLPIEAMRSYLLNSRALLGTPQATATVTLAPRVSVSGLAGGVAIEDSFRPTADLVLADDTLTVSSTDGQPVTADSPVLNPSATGEISTAEEVPGTMPVPVLDLPVAPTRWIALVVLLGSTPALVVLGRRLLARREGGEEVTRLLGLHGSQIVSVTSLTLRDGPVADVATFDDLLALARRYNSSVMHLADDDGDTFWLWDTGLSYRFRVAPVGVVTAVEEDPGPGVVDADPARDPGGAGRASGTRGPRGLAAVRDRGVHTAPGRAAR